MHEDIRRRALAKAARGTKKGQWRFYTDQLTLKRLLCSGSAVSAESRTFAFRELKLLEGVKTRQLHIAPNTYVLCPWLA
jgi:hypothetical protein